MAISMTTARTALGGLLALALAPALWPGDAAAHTCDDPFRTDLLTARGINVGDVKVCNDAEFLTVTYETVWPWCVLKTNLHVARDLAGIPKFKLLGTPNFLRFDFIDDVDCDVPAPVQIPLAGIGDDGGVLPGETVTIAARAVVEGEGPDGTHPRCLLGDKCVAWGEGPRFRPRLPVMYFTYEVQAPPPSTSCVCDSRTATGGTTGAALLNLLCPNRSLGSGVIFEDSSSHVGPRSTITAPPTRYQVIADPTGAACLLADQAGPAPPFFPRTFLEAEVCRTHLRVSCGQPGP